jgi:hypothetical protein
MKEQRSTTANENIQEVLDAESNAAHATLAGQNQYFTPPWLVDQCNARLPVRTPATVLDPQVGEGALVEVGEYSSRYGCDIDNRLDRTRRCSLIIANCVKVFETFQELYPDLRWVCGNANPPYGKNWKTAQGIVDSTEWTWRLMIKRANCGYFISNHSTMVKLGIDKHPLVYHYETHDGADLWKGMRDTLKIGIAFWKHPENDWEHTPVMEINKAWKKVQEVIDQERSKRPDYNIYLDERGYLRTYLSIRSEIKLKLSRNEILRLHSINECHPLTLTTEKETRGLMQSLVKCGVYSIQPAARAAIEQALAEVNSLACPIMPITDFEAVAYADEEEALKCKASQPNLHLTPGKSYPITTGSYKFTDKFTRNKVHFDEETFLTYTKQHECTLSGQDRYIQVFDDIGMVRRFMDRPKVVGIDNPESMLWELFEKPTVKTITDACPELVDQNGAVLRSCEMIAGYKYYPGQHAYLARVAAKKQALIAAATGTGKTLMAISLLAMKCPERALIIAPQGTMRSTENADEDDDEDGGIQRQPVGAGDCTVRSHTSKSGRYFPRKITSASAPSMVAPCRRESTSPTTRPCSSMVPVRMHRIHGMTRS